MARNRILPLMLVAALGGCAASPLYVQHQRGGTVGEIPRDGRGEPMWDEIHTPAPPPQAPYVPPAAGIPVTTPNGTVVPPPPPRAAAEAPPAPTYALTPPPKKRSCKHLRHC